METGKVEHKTEVRVLWQELQHEGWGRYSGMLQVERLDNGKHLYVDVKTFITKPYWTYSDLQEAARVGTYLARFQQVSNHYPVNKNGEGVDLEDGMVIAVVGNTGTYGHGGPDDETNQLEALVFKEWQSGYEGVQVFFNAEDLTIVY